MEMKQQAQNPVNDLGALIEGINVFVITDMDQAEPLWREWQATAHTTVFQTIDWCKHWMKLCGEGLKPHIVYGLSANGDFVFLLPFCVDRRCLKWIGQDHLIYGYGVYSDWALSEAGQIWFDNNAPTLVRLDERVNRIDLQHLPGVMHGHRHPLLSLSNCTDPDTSCILNLSSDYDTLFTQKRSASSRTTIRNRDKRLAQLGDMKFAALSGDEDAHAALDELLEDQAARLAENGISSPVDETYRKLMHRWLDPDIALLQVTRLSIDGKSVASLLLTQHSDTMVFLMVSLARGPSRKFSPGDLALRKTIEFAINQGYKQFDFSLGALSYKAPWTDVVVHHHHASRVLRASGIPMAGLTLAKHGFRKWFKSTPVIWDNFEKVRRMLRGKAQVDA
jgi:CelD/BcsL family acetyltransferase involved in cellulose biosynthesis